MYNTPVFIPGPSTTMAVYIAVICRGRIVTLYLGQVRLGPRGGTVVASEGKSSIKLHQT